jgi:hypothetical protein
MTTELPRTRFLLIWALAPAYGALAFWLVARPVPHYEWIIAGLQFLLVPVFWLARTNSRPVPPSAAWLLLPPFLVLSLAMSKSVSAGVQIPDESAYRFEARTLYSGKMMAAALPGAPEIPINVPAPLRFAHHILSKKGWYAKYPPGWPLLLAIPERLGLGWAVTPVLGCVLLVLIGSIAREVGGPDGVFPAVWMGSVSPYFLSNSIGYMSHALSSVLIAGALLLALRGTRARSLLRLAAMLALLAAAFHVRPFPAFLASVVMGLSVLIFLRREKRLFAIFAFFSTVSAAAVILSMLEYNRLFTGNPWLSPYAVYRGTSVPSEVTIDPSALWTIFVTYWRIDAQSSWIFCFPFVFVLAAIGLFRHSRSKKAWMLAAFIGAMCVGHFFQKEISGSTLGNRYWFEAFVATLVLAAPVMARRMNRPAVWALTLAQALLFFGAVRVLERRIQPTSAMRAVAELYRNCDCVVFMKDAESYFYHDHLNINDADWQSARVFYMGDPGTEARSEWAARFGRTRWAVLEYDPRAMTANISQADSRLDTSF